MEIAKDSKVPLVPSIMMAGEGSNGGMGGIPGLLLAMVAKDALPFEEGSKRRPDGSR